jgi:hypothetical protein
MSTEVRQELQVIPAQVKVVKHVLTFIPAAAASGSR